MSHKASDRRCPTKGKQCRKCNGAGHFEVMCNTKEKQNRGQVGGGLRKPDTRCRATHHERQVEAEDEL